METLKLVLIYRHSINYKKFCLEVQPLFRRMPKYVSYHCYGEENVRRNIESFLNEDQILWIELRDKCDLFVFYFWIDKYNEWQMTGLLEPSKRVNKIGEAELRPLGLYGHEMKCEGDVAFILSETFKYDAVAFLCCSSMSLGDEYDDPPLSQGTLGYLQDAWKYADLSPRDVTPVMLTSTQVKEKRKNNLNH